MNGFLFQAPRRGAQEIPNCKEDEKMKTKLCLVALLSLVLLSMISPSAHAQATVYRYAWTVEVHDFLVYNAAADEHLLASGIARYSMQWVTDSMGIVHWMYHGEHNLRGLGLTTGCKYQVISTFTQHQNNVYGFPSEWTFVNTSPLICEGQVSNARFTIRNHVTVNANGEVTVSFCEIEIWCQGQP